MHTFSETDPQSAIAVGRRGMLSRCGMGFGALAMTGFLNDRSVQASPFPEAALNPMSPKPAQFPSKIKHVIHLFMNGGPSHVDTFDPKPELQRRGGGIGAAALCGGGGQGDALIVRTV